MKKLKFYERGCQKSLSKERSNGDLNKKQRDASIKFTKRPPL
jgi:hypothetical protein